MKRVLAISSSRVGNGGYLQSAANDIGQFLGNQSLSIGFIPFASVDGYDEYLEKVRVGLQSLSHRISLINTVDDIQQADVIMVGGGNTFKLLHHIYQRRLFNVIKQKVESGTPYIGWSAGANLAGKTICTTNDMPIIEPESFTAFNFLPFQINPHYLNVQPEGYHGETRDQRLEEFVKLNPTLPVIGLPEGTLLLLENSTLTFKGTGNGVIFTNENRVVSKKEFAPGSDLTQLLN